jgi:hypothetical protein
VDVESPIAIQTECKQLTDCEQLRVCGLLIEKLSYLAKEVNDRAFIPLL